MKEKDQLITIKDAAAATDFHAKTWYGWVETGRCPLPVIRLGGRRRPAIRFRRKDLENFIAGRPVARRRGRPTKAEQMARGQQEG